MQMSIAHRVEVEEIRNSDWQGYPVKLLKPTIVAVVDLDGNSRYCGCCTTDGACDASSYRIIRQPLWQVADGDGAGGPRGYGIGNRQVDRIADRLNCLPGFASDIPVTNQLKVIEVESTPSVA